LSGILNLPQRKEERQRTKVLAPNSQKINTGNAAKTESGNVKSHSLKQGK
jgi:hypothetical protein